jgi:hypothetical protein
MGGNRCSGGGGEGGEGEGRSGGLEAVLEEPKRKTLEKDIKRD